MKFTLATAAIFLTGVLAAPAPEAEPEPWCLRPGQGCWKVKRAADAFTEAIHSSGGLSERSPAAEFSNRPGGAAFMAKRQINELANLIALTSGDPSAFYGDLGLNNEFDTDSDDDKEKRDAAPEPWCLRPGQGCWKRDANAADSFSEDKRWCLRPGQGCWKAKRAAEAVLSAIGSADADADALDEKPFDPAFFAKRDAEPWCLRPGQGCWKRDAEANPEPWCLRPGQGCWKAKRDLLAIRSAAMDIVESLN